jgi:hypothetical protein
MISYIIAGLFITLIVVLVIGGDHNLRLRVKSTDTKETYTAEKKKDARGNSFLDWFYYDEEGENIEDENLKKMIFEAFSDEDWYGDYEFYTSTGKVKEVETTEAT